MPISRRQRCRCAIALLTALLLAGGCDSDQPEPPTPAPPPPVAATQPQADASPPATQPEADGPETYHIAWECGPGWVEVQLNGFPEIFTPVRGSGRRQIHYFVRDGRNEVAIVSSRFDERAREPVVRILATVAGQDIEAPYYLARVYARPDGRRKSDIFTGKVAARRVWEDAEKFGQLTDDDEKAIRGIVDEIWEALKSDDVAKVTRLRDAAIRDKAALTGRPIDEIRTEWQQEAGKFYARGQGAWQRRTGGDLLLTEFDRCVVVHDVVTDSQDRWVFRRPMQVEPGSDALGGWLNHQDLLFIRLDGKWQWLR